MTTRNAPTPEGRSLGAHLARFADRAEEKLRDRMAARNVDKPVPERCQSCAFRDGTLPNGCPTTVMDAVKCLMEGDTFLCHASPVDEAGAHVGVCAGFLLLEKGGLVEGVGRMPWEYSDEAGSEGAP